MRSLWKLYFSPRLYLKLYTVTMIKICLRTVILSLQLKQRKFI